MALAAHLHIMTARRLQAIAAIIAVPQVLRTRIHAVAVLVAVQVQALAQAAPHVVGAETSGILHAAYTSPSWP